jgi:putative ABC transport system substrate-binding protein
MARPSCEWRFAEERRERLADLTAELVQLPVDALVTVGTPATRAAKQASTTIPIIQVGGDDPVAAGLVASLARPGGNVTGLPLVPGPSLGKILELLKAAMSGISHVAILVTPGSRSFWLRGTEEEALALGLQLHVLEGESPKSSRVPSPPLSGRVSRRSSFH